jgi:hypothetical protein
MPGRLNDCDVRLLQAYKEHDAAMNHQRWCHANVFNRDPETAEQAREDHDWHACPDCTRIEYDRRFPTMLPLSPHMERKKRIKKERCKRRAATRRARRRDQRSSKPT